MALCSAVAFGTLPILAKLAYQEGFAPAQLLSWRFLFATAGMTILAATAGARPWRIALRKFALLLLLGALFYGGQSFLFFTALIWLPAGFVSLVLYTYPAIVVLAGWLLLARRLQRRLAAAVAGSLVGIALLSGGLTAGPSFALPLALAIPVAYAAYLIAAEHVMRGEQALAASAVVMAGAALFWLAAALLRNEFVPPSGDRAWLVLAIFAIVPSMIAIPMLLSALRRIGSERVALLSTCEPVVTVLLAAFLLGERLGWLQCLGAALVLGAMLLVYWPGRAASLR